MYSITSSIWLVGSTTGKSKERMMYFCCFLVLSISEALLEVPGSFSNWSSNHFFFKAVTAEFISCHSQREKILITPQSTLISLDHHLLCFPSADSKALWDAKRFLQNYLTFHLLHYQTNQVSMTQFCLYIAEV